VGAKAFLLQPNILRPYPKKNNKQQQNIQLPTAMMDKVLSAVK
jgi:hypothetical protein